MERNLQLGALKKLKLFWKRQRSPKFSNTVKPRKEEPIEEIKKQQTVLQNLYPLNKNQNQAVVGLMFLIKNILFSPESDFNSICLLENFKQSGLCIDY